MATKGDDDNALRESNDGRVPEELSSISNQRDNLSEEKANNTVSAWRLALDDQNGDNCESSESMALSVMENGDAGNCVQQESDVVQRLHAQLQHNERVLQEEAKRNNDKSAENTASYCTSDSAARNPSASSTKTPAPPELNRRDDYRQPGAVAIVGTQNHDNNTSGEAAEEGNSEQMTRGEVPKERSAHLVSAELVIEEEEDNLHKVSATSAVPMEEDDLPLSQQRLKSILKDRRVSLCLCAFILVLAGLATGLSFLLLQKDDDDGSTITPVFTSSPTTASPTTTPPTASPTSRMAWLQTLLGKYYVDDDVTPWEIADSPQFQSLYFLADEDPWRPPKQVDDHTAERLVVERYAVMVLYYALHGGSWNLGWELVDDIYVSTSICEWQTQYCELGDCDKIGILCNSELFVTGFEMYDGVGAIGTIPTEVGLLSSLQSLKLNNNTGMVGTLPKELFHIPALESVSLTRNSLTGSLPSELLEAPRLGWLDLDQNNLNGTIENIANPVLQEFAISENRFTGTIPESLGDLKDATYIEIGGNLLSGTLPSSLSSLEALSYLSVYNNANLTGPVPSSYNNLILSTLYMEGTNLTQVESPLCGNDSLPLPPNYTEFYAECGGSTPKVSCWCCTHCCDKRVCLPNTLDSG